MKFIKINRLSIALLCTFFIPTQATEKPLYDPAKLSSYRKATHTIDTALQKRIFWLPSIFVSNNFFLNNAKKRLAEIENNLRVEEKNAIIAFAKEHNISDKLLRECLSRIAEHKTAEQDFLASESCILETTDKNAIHDTTFPQEIIPLLKQNGINPERISLIDSQQPCSSYDAAATANCTYFQLGAFREIVITKPLNITVYPSFHESDKLFHKSLLLHEIEHILSGHNIINQWLVKYVMQSTNKAFLDIEQSKTYQQLRIVQERQAEIFSALRNPEYSHAHRNLRLHCYYPDHTFIEHYAQLAEIDELHKLKNIFYDPTKMASTIAAVLIPSYCKPVEEIAN